MDLDERVNAATLAEALNLKKTRINELVSNGILHPTGSPRMYVFREANHAYIDYLKSRIDPSKDDDRQINSNKLKADAAYKAARAKSAQLELEELEGKMHRSEDVQAAFESFAYTVRSALMALPGRLAVDLAVVSNPMEVSEIIRAQVYEIMEELAEFEYDPQFYAEQVRERRGWTSDAPEGEQGSS